MDVIVCKWDASIVDELHDLGLKICLVVDDFDLAYESPDLNEVAHWFQVSSFDSIDEVAGVATAISLMGHNIEYILSHTEYSQYGAAIIAQLLGLKNFDLPMIVATRDKRVMKKKLLESDLKKYIGIQKSIPLVNENTLSAVTEDMTFPVILKPVNGQGSRLTFKIENPSAVAKAASDYNSTEDFIIKSKQAVVEEFIEGEEYHVDAVWKDGVPKLFSISKYWAPRLAVSQEGKPNGSFIMHPKLDSELFDQVQEMHFGLNNALGVDNCATHLEFFKKDDEEKIFFSEIASRIGGGGINDAVGMAYGVDIVRSLVRGIFQKNFSCSRHTNLERVGWIDLRPQTLGKLKAVPDAQKIRELEYVTKVYAMKQVGDNFTDNSPSNWCCIVMYTAPDMRKLIVRRDYLLKNFKYEL